MSTAATTDSDWKLPSHRKVGVICLLIAETALFAIFVVAYVYYIGRELNPPFPSDVLKLPILATICLLSSSGTIVMAEGALKKGSVSGFRLWWGATILLALIFLIFTALEWRELIVEDGLYISTNVFGTTFYSLVGLHATHVVIGSLLLSTVLLFSFAGKLQQRHHEHIEMVSWYWHFVDAVWIVVFLVVYVIGR